MSRGDTSCDRCGSEIKHRAKATRAERAARRFCSSTCANRSRPIRPQYERMMEKVVTVPEAGCWLYTGSVDGGGYGTVSSKRGQPPGKAHRISYSHHHGEIPAGLSVCHKCDTPSCVNPDHLFLGTQQDNVRDCWKKSRNNDASMLNLRPGAKGFHGAGPLTVRDRNS